MYPLHMQLPAPAIGFALANDEAEHARLTAAGYLPPLVAVERHAADRAALLVDAEAKGLKIDRRWSDARIAEELAKA